MNNEKNLMRLKEDFTKQCDGLRLSAVERYPKLEKYISNIRIEALAQIMGEW